MSLQRRLYEIIEIGGHTSLAGRFFDKAMILLILANVLAVALETVPAYSVRYREHFLIFEIISVTIFTIEYLMRVWVAPLPLEATGTPRWKARLKYILTPLALIDLLAILPFFLASFIVADLRFLRVFRLLRLLKLVRYSPALGSLWKVIYEERRALLAALIIMLGIVFTAASLMWFVERSVQPDALGSIPDALWWALATLTTVGYGDVVPITPLGKVIGGFMMVFGLAFYAVPIGIIASAFSSEIHRRDFVARFGVIAKIPLFQGLQPEILTEISRMLRTITVEAGKVISYRGYHANGLYFVLSGRVKLQGPHSEREIKSGDFFGDLSFLKEEFKNQAVVAKTHTNLLFMESRDLEHLLFFRPELYVRLQELLEKRLEAALKDGVLTEEDRKNILDEFKNYFGSS